MMHFLYEILTAFHAHKPLLHCYSVKTGVIYHTICTVGNPIHVK